MRVFIEYNKTFCMIFVSIFSEKYLLLNAPIKTVFFNNITNNYIKKKKEKLIVFVRDIQFLYYELTRKSISFKFVV